MVALAVSRLMRPSNLGRKSTMIDNFCDMQNLTDQTNVFGLVTRQFALWSCFAHKKMLKSASSAQSTRLCALAAGRRITPSELPHNFTL